MCAFRSHTEDSGLSKHLQMMGHRGFMDRNVEAPAGQFSPCPMRWYTTESRTGSLKACSTSARVISSRAGCGNCFMFFFAPSKDSRCFLVDIENCQAEFLLFIPPSVEEPWILSFSLVSVGTLPLPIIGVRLRVSADL